MFILAVFIYVFIEKVKISKHVLLKCLPDQIFYKEIGRNVLIALSLLVT